MPDFSKIDATEEEKLMPFVDDTIEDEDIDEDEDEAVDETDELAELSDSDDDLDGESESENALDTQESLKSKIVYICPRCRKIYYKNKWQKDAITEIYTVKTELAFCPKDQGKSYEDFVGVVQLFDQDLAEKKESVLEEAGLVQHELEDAESFEKILSTNEKNGVLFIFTNTTRLALEIGKRLRQEFGGAVQYEWFERNQFLRIRWYDELENRDKYRKQIKELSEFRYGVFPFEE